MGARKTGSRKAAKKKTAKKKAAHERVDATLAVDRALDALKEDYRVFSSVERPPSAKDIARAEKAIGRVFPADYRRLIERRGAVIVDVKPEIWRRPVEFEVRPSWQMDYARVVFGVSRPGEGPPWLDVAQQARDVADRGGPGEFLPVLRRLGGNGDVYGFGDDDAFCLLSHETQELEPAGSFVETLLDEIESLRQDRERLRETPIPPAAPVEDEDNRRRHVLMFEAELRPDRALTVLRAFVDAARAELPAIEVLEGARRVRDLPVTAKGLCSGEARRRPGADVPYRGAPRARHAGRARHRLVSGRARRCRIEA
jgi:hypothetical protein